MSLQLRNAPRFLAKLCLYSLALLGLFVLIYRGLGFGTSTDIHRIAVINQAQAELTDVQVIIGHGTYSTSNIDPSGKLDFVAVENAEGAIGFSAVFEGRKIDCSFGYITSGTYDFDLGKSITMFWVQPDGEITVSQGTWNTHTSPSTCRKAASPD